jgi:YihY family inner membrane protein
LLSPRRCANGPAGQDHGPANVKPLLLLATKTWERFGADNATQMAAAMAYYVLFAIVPLAMFIIAIAGAAASDPDAQGKVTAWIEDYLQVAPGDVRIGIDADATDAIEARYGADALVEIEEELAAISGSPDREEERKGIAESVDAGQAVDVSGYQLNPDELEVQSDNLIANTLRSVAAASVPLGLVGLVALAFSATIAFSAIRRSLNVVWGGAYRPFFQQRLLELTMLVGLVVLLGASVATTGAAQVLRELNDGQQNPLESLGGIFWFAFGYVLPWAFTFALLVLAYRFVPNAQISVGEVWLGAFLAATGIEVLKYGYGVYVVNFASYGPVYGALAGILLFMFFTYLASYIFLMGAELASEYPRVLRGEYDERPAEPAGEMRNFREIVFDAVRGLFFSGRG